MDETPFTIVRVCPSCRKDVSPVHDVDLCQHVMALEQRIRELENALEAVHLDARYPPSNYPWHEIVRDFMPTRWQEDRKHDS